MPISRAGQAKQSRRTTWKEAQCDNGVLAIPNVPWLSYVPPEVWYTILEYLPAKVLGNCRQLCKELEPFAGELLFQRINISHRLLLTHGVHALKNMSTTFGRHVKSLKIHAKEFTVDSEALTTLIGAISLLKDKLAGVCLDLTSPPLSSSTLVTALRTVQTTNLRSLELILGSDGLPSELPPTEWYNRITHLTLWTRCSSDNLKQNMYDFVGNMASLENASIYTRPPHSADPALLDLHLFQIVTALRPERLERIKLCGFFDVQVVLARIDPSRIRSIRGKNIDNANWMRLFTRLQNPGCNLQRLDLVKVSAVGQELSFPHYVGGPRRCYMDSPGSREFAQLLQNIASDRTISVTPRQGNLLQLHLERACRQRERLEG